MIRPTLEKAYSNEKRRTAAMNAMAERVCPKCSAKLLTNRGGFKMHVNHCGEEKNRFWSKVSKGDGCWIFRGCRDKWGYAHHGIKGKRRQAHRLAYEFTNGPIPAGQLVLHTCDNPPCCNPTHLFLGTDADNMLDKVRKGRDNTATITAEQVREIREALKNPYHGIQNELARKYGVRNGVISDIKLGVTFAWLK